VDELTDRAVKIPEAVSGEVTVDAVALASNSSFDSPWSVTADPDGGAWVLDKGTGSVVKVRPDGGRGAELTGFNYPFDAAVSATTNNLYVVDYDAGLLASFDKSLQGSQSWDVAADFTVKGLLAATDVEIDETGGFVFVASDGRVGRYDTAGVLLSECVGIQTPVAVAADPGRSTP
jgi:streptogramin lyase